MNQFCLEEIAEIRTNFRSADFWLTRKNSASLVGEPKLTTSNVKEDIGIKITSSKFETNFIYYYLLHQYQLGFFRMISRGTIRLKHLTIDSVKHINLLQSI